MNEKATLKIIGDLFLPIEEIEFRGIRAEGAGGQNVNKVSSAIHLRFDIRASSLPDPLKEKLYQLKDQRISQDGVIVIKAQSYRSQTKNRMNAQERLVLLIRSVAVVRKNRKATQPTRASRQRRLDSKKRQSQAKQRRRSVDLD